MLRGSKPLTAGALCLLGLSAFAQAAAAAQWIDSGRTAYLKYSLSGSFAEHTRNAGTAPIQGYPGSCANVVPSGWTANYAVSSEPANEQVNACEHNTLQLGLVCYSLASAINGQVYAGRLPAAWNIGARAVINFARMETGEIQYE